MGLMERLTHAAEKSSKEAEEQRMERKFQKLQKRKLAPLLKRVTKSAEIRPAVWKESRWQRIRRQGRELKEYQQQEPSKIEKKIGGIIRTAGRFAPKPKRRLSYQEKKAKILRGVKSVFPTGRLVQDGKLKTGRRGRPKGSFTYFIPGRGKVDVFTYKKWLNLQKRTLRQQFQQQFAMRNVRTQVLREEFPEQYLPRALYNPTQQFVQPIQPSLKEISILERTPLTLGMENQETFIEKDLISGVPRIRKRGNLL